MKIVHVFSFLTKTNQSRDIGVQIRKRFDVNVKVKYSHHFMGVLPVEFQWYVYQNKVAVGFLEITFYSLGKVKVYRMKSLSFLLLLQNL